MSIMGHGFDIFKLELEHTYTHRAAALEYYKPVHIICTAKKKLYKMKRQFLHSHWLS